jgi:hypothetical protein
MMERERIPTMKVAGNLKATGFADIQAGTLFLVEDSKMYRPAFKIARLANDSNDYFVFLTSTDDEPAFFLIDGGNYSSHSVVTLDGATLVPDMESIKSASYITAGDIVWASYGFDIIVHDSRDRYRINVTSGEVGTPNPNRNELACAAWKIMQPPLFEGELPTEVCARSRKP